MHSHGRSAHPYTFHTKTIAYTRIDMLFGMVQLPVIAKWSIFIYQILSIAEPWRECSCVGWVMLEPPGLGGNIWSHPCACAAVTEQLLYEYISRGEEGAYWHSYQQQPVALVSWAPTVSPFRSKAEMGRKERQRKKIFLFLLFYLLGNITKHGRN